MGEPFTSTFLYVSEEELRNTNYEVLELLKPGDTITLEFVIELYMSKEQAESATGYIGLVLAYPYIEIQYPVNHLKTISLGSPITHFEKIKQEVRISTRLSYSSEENCHSY